MAREHPDEEEEKKKETPEVIEREINLSLINAKLNDLTGLVLAVAKELNVKVN